jgi:serine/threonine-protein kinase PknG
VALLENAPDRTVEVELALARVLIDNGRADDAVRVLERVERADPWEWRTAWYRGLAHLRVGDPAAALPHFDLVYRRVPGELAPKLAQAFAAEAAGDTKTAARGADIVSRTDPSFTSAAFCLARCRYAQGDRPGSIEALDRVPEHSSAYVEAQIAKARTILDVDDRSDVPPSVDAIVAAGRVLDALPLGADQQTRLSALVLEAALSRIHYDGADHDDAEVFGHRCNEREIRTALEASFRSLARRSHTKAERIEFVRRANHARPWTAL